MRPDRSTLTSIATAVVGLCVGFLGSHFTAPPASSVSDNPTKPSPHVGAPLQAAAVKPLPINQPEEPDGLMPLAAALKMRLDGNYVLESEIAERVARLEERADRTAEETMHKRALDYQALFSSMHFDQKTQTQLLDHLQKLYKAKALVANSMAVLQKARESYDERAESILGDKYDQYLAYEAAYLPSVELKELTKLASSKNNAVSSDEAPLIQALIQEENALTLNSFADLGGPYGEVRPPSSGKDFAPAMTAQSGHLKQQYENILAKAEKIGLSPSATRALKDYYENELSRYSRMIAQSSPAPTRE